MKSFPYKDFSEFQALAASTGFAAICGWLNYLLSVQEGRPFSWREMILHCAISAMCGLISYELLAFEGFPPGVCGALSGMAGWGGTRLIRLIGIALAKRAGVTKEELNDK